MTPSRRPTLTICIPSYNTERYVRTTIESALAQELPVDEVLISDDNSTDGSLALIRQYERVPKVRIIRPASRITLGEHYRFLVENARSDYVCLLSADDALVPTFSQRMLRDVPTDGSVGMVIGGWIETDQAMKPKLVRGLNLPKGSLPAPQGMRHFAAGCGYIISATIISRPLLLALDPLPAQASLPTDWYWAIRLGAISTIQFVNQPVAYYRFHDANSSHSDPNRWRRAAREMILFTRSKLPPAEAALLDPTLADIERSMSQAVEPTPSGGLKRQLKHAVEGFLALRYRRSPEFITLAEQGLSMALKRLRQDT